MTQKNTSDFQKFIAYTKQTSLARTNRYSIVIAGYPVSLAAMGEGLTLMCDAASHPGYSVGTKDSSYTNIATMRPDGSLDYKNVSGMSFLLDENQSIKSFFVNWMKLVVDPSTGFVRYPENYICSSITINQLDMMDNITYTTTLYDAYPIEIGAVDVSNDASNTFSRINIQFTFTSWDSTSTPKKLSK